MKLHVISSGSSGNSYCVETDTDLLFFDIGASVTRVKRSLASLFPCKTVSLFLTHEHFDHVSGIAPFIRAFNPKVYSSVGTADYIKRTVAPMDDVNILTAGVRYDIGAFSVIPFNVSHDAAEPFGYKLIAPCGNIGFLTDLGYVTTEQLAYMEDVCFLVLEANHDEKMLKAGKYPASLKKRIASNKGHLSNSDAFAVLTALHGGSLSCCLFAHISEENNDYNLLEKLGKFCSEQYGIKTGVLRQKSYTSYELSAV